MGIGAFFPVHEVEHSPVSSAEVKNGGIIPKLSNRSSWHSAVRKAVRIFISISVSVQEPEKSNLLIGQVNFC
jgi:hypothetical protein